MADRATATAVAGSPPTSARAWRASRWNSARSTRIPVPRTRSSLSRVTASWAFCLNRPNTVRSRLRPASGSASGHNASMARSAGTRPPATATILSNWAACPGPMATARPPPPEVLPSQGDVAHPVEAVRRFGEELRADDRPPVGPVGLGLVGVLQSAGRIPPVRGEDHALPVDEGGEQAAGVAAHPQDLVQRGLRLVVTPQLCQDLRSVEEEAARSPAVTGGVRYGLV